MCLAVPMKIVSIDGHTACCEAKGVMRTVSLSLLDAQATWDLFDEIAVALDHEDA
jgi:hydrogenase assembly chaperone HypC/HupF